MTYEPKLTLLAETPSGKIFLFDVLINETATQNGGYASAQYAAQQAEKMRAELCMDQRGNNCVISIYMGNELIASIRWEQHWLYKCACLKENSAHKQYIDDSDFVPCALPFEEIMHELVSNKTMSGKLSVGLETAGFEICPKFSYSELKQL